jgi:hypothetical protein
MFLIPGSSMSFFNDPSIHPQRQNKPEKRYHINGGQSWFKGTEKFGDKHQYQHIVHVADGGGEPKM